MKLYRRKEVFVVACALLAGCQAPLPTCGDEAVTDLVIQIFQERYHEMDRSDFRGAEQLARAEKLADENLSIVTTLTHKAATAETPQAMCEAKIHLSSYDVAWNYRALEEEKEPTSVLPPSPRERARTMEPPPNATDEEREDYEAARLQANRDYSQAQAEARKAAKAVEQRNQQRREAFHSDPANITRQGPRQEREFTVLYTAAATDDGRAFVRVQRVE